MSQYQYPGAAPAAASVLGISAATNVSGRFSKLPAGVQCLVEVLGTELVLNAVLQGGKRDDRFYGTFRVLEVYVQGETPIVPGGEFSFGETIRSDLGQATIFSFIASAVGLNPANAADPKVQALKTDTSFQNACADRGSKTLATKRLIVHTRRHRGQHSPADGSRDKIVHVFSPVTP